MNYALAMAKPALPSLPPVDLVAVHGGVQSRDEQLTTALQKIQTDLKDAARAQNQPSALQQMMPMLLAAKASGRL